MKNLADFLVEFIQQPTLSAKINFLSHQSEFDEIQCFFFLKKTLVKSLGITSFLYHNKEENIPAFDDHLLEVTQNTVSSNAKREMAFSIVVESKPIGYIRLPHKMLTRDLKVVLNALKNSSKRNSKFNFVIVTKS